MDIIRNPKDKSCFLAIVGRPNVGKSSLLNALLGHKLAIVSDKPQTTRTKVTGILTQGDTQFVFIDTPGFHQPRTKLGVHMQRHIKESASGVDAITFVTECTGELKKNEEALLETLMAAKIPVILVLNKTDILKKKDDMLVKIAQLTERYTFDSVVPVSALTGDGVDKVLLEATKFGQPGGFFYPEDQLSTDTERFVASEIIREKLLLNLSEEVPHGTGVQIEKMQEREGGQMVDIDCVIYCEKDSHKGIIIGKKGETLKTVLTQARKDLEEFLGLRVNLQCFVKVREKWRDREGIIRNLELNS